MALQQTKRRRPCARQHASRPRQTCKADRGVIQLCPRLNAAVPRHEFGDACADVELVGVRSPPIATQGGNCFHSALIVQVGIQIISICLVS